jgi:hypothetical protein
MGSTSSPGDGSPMGRGCLAGRVNHGDLPALRAHPCAGGRRFEPRDVIGQLAWQRRDEAVLVNPCRAFRYRREAWLIRAR